MSSTIKNIFTELEDLISEASRYNTEVISETTKFLSNMDRSKLNREYLSNLQQGVFSEAIQKIVALNINYAKDLMQMGIDLSKKLNETSGSTETSSGITKPPIKSSVSAFRLEANAEQGGQATTAFLLNSDKEAPILCKVQNAAFQLNSDDIFTDFETEYSPQLFELVKGIAQRVDVKINIPETTQEGIYTSKITVAGFEYTHFDLIVEVTKKKVAPSKKVAATKPKVTAAKTTKKAATTTRQKALAKTTAIKAKPARKKTTAKKTTATKPTTRKKVAPKKTTLKKN